MRPRVAGSLDDVPCAGSKGAKGAEGDGLVGVVQRLGPDDLVVVLVLLVPVLVPLLHANNDNNTYSVKS